VSVERLSKFRPEGVGDVPTVHDVMVQAGKSRKVKARKAKARKGVAQ
jgi:hypothetical protein